jgi:hypothetical protein
MTLVKAILAVVLALGALTTTFSAFGTQLDGDPRCVPCSN